MPLIADHSARFMTILRFAVMLSFISSAAIGQVVDEDFKLIPSDGASGDAFGQSLAIHNGVVSIGASSDDDNGTDSGSAHIMHLILDVAPIKLVAFDGATNDLFGFSTAIGVRNSTQGTLGVVVGSPNDSDNGTNSGSAYLFDSSSGNHLFKLLPNDGGFAHHFGQSVAIDNEIIVVGAPDDDDNGLRSGSAYIFDANTGQQLAKLLPNNGAPNDAFGFKVAISGDIIAVSAPRHHNNGIESGSVYLFSASKASQFAEISSNEGVPFEQFGYSLSIDNGTVAVGALATASAYIYNASTQALIHKLVPSIPGESFGWDIDIQGNRVVVGAIQGDGLAINTGLVYLFNPFTGVEIATLRSSDGTFFNQFGSSVGVYDDFAVVGARSSNDNGTSSGSAYVYDLYCPADINGDGVLNFFDISSFLTAFNNQNPVADFNNDGLFNFFDISAFLTAFSAGCP
ncbi:MAG: GC-type dockerin domain-anchored protein [Phycisphaerales bacterium]|nr:GC-type dockerin domain-anchored protein [Phycisphaerales bacterium]